MEHDRVRMTHKNFLHEIFVNENNVNAQAKNRPRIVAADYYNYSHFRSSGGSCPTSVCTYTYMQEIMSHLFAALWEDHKLPPGICKAHA